jgi:hypothetical protein
MPDMRRSYSPSPTVRASHQVPLFSGPSGIGLAGDYEAITPGTFHVQSSAVDNLVAQGFSPDEAELVYAAGVSGLITHEEWHAAKQGHLSFADLSDAIFSRSVPAHEGLGGLGDETYMDYSNDFVEPSLSEPTYSDYSNELIPYTPAFDPARPLFLMPGSAYPTAAELTPSYSPLPSSLTTPPGFNAQNTSQIMNNAAAAAQAASQLARGGVTYLPPTQNLSTLRPASASPSSVSSLLSKQTVPGIPNVALLIAGGIALAAMAAK